MEYWVEHGEATDLDRAKGNLCVKVEILLREGWTLQGGINLVLIENRYDYTYILSQALTRGALGNAAHSAGVAEVK